MGEHDLAGQHLGDARQLVGCEHQDVVERDDPDHPIVVDDWNASNRMVSEHVHEIVEIAVASKAMSPVLMRLSTRPSLG